MNKIKLKQMLDSFFIEDVGERDVTSISLFPENMSGSGHFVAKEDGIFVGKEIITQGYKLLDEQVEFQFLKKDGDDIQKGEIIATVQGSMSALLTGERVILNLIQRMSGIATLTNEAVKKLNSDFTKVCDTRKTTPGLRMLEKYAVLCGGGSNHRYGLYDGVMIKDNHIEFCGSITKAVEKARKTIGHMVKIEVETETREQVMEAVEAGADVIMFDNRTPEEMKEFVQLVPSSIITEASGGINMSTISNFRDTGVHYISLGFLTHSARALDISFNAGNKK